MAKYHMVSFRVKGAAPQKPKAKKKDKKKAKTNGFGFSEPKKGDFPNTKW